MRPEFILLMNVLLRLFPLCARFSCLLVALAWLALPAAAQSGLPVPGLPYWEWQSPRPTGQWLEALHVFDDQTALVGGWRGTLLKTTDQGQSWTALNSGAPYDIKAISFVSPQVGWIANNTPNTSAPANNLFLAGPGEVRKTVDGGQTWTVQSIGEPDFVQITALKFFSATQGYVAYDINEPANFRRRLRVTNDGGQTWTIVPFAGQRVQFVTPQVGYRVIDNFVVKTTNGGQTSTLITPDPSLNYSQLFFTDELNGWVASGATTTTPNLFHTTDGGATWTPVNISGISNYYPGISLLSFADAQHGIIDYQVTNNGGQSWSFASGVNAFAFEVRAAQLLPSGAGFAVGANGYITSTTDFGLTNQRRDTRLLGRADEVPNLNVVRFPEPGYGWALAGIRFTGPLPPDGSLTVFRTRDAGATWQAQDLTTRTPGGNWSTSRLSAGAFPDRDTAYVAGYSQASTSTRIGFMLRTVDAGQSWTRQLLPTTAVVNNLQFADGRHGVAVGEQGTVLYTRDAGVTWLPASSGTTAPLRKVCWASPQVAYALGAPTTFIKTTDGGATWQPVATSFFASGFLLAGKENITFTSATTGFFYSDASVYRTTDGGQTWGQTFLRSSATLTGSAFGPASHGWAFGSMFSRTTDGGQTWTPPFYIGLTVLAGDMVDAYNGWVVGENGLVMHYAEKTLTTAPLTQTSYCAGAAVSVAFASTGTYPGSEQRFRVELSNAHGRFRPGEVQTIAQGTSSPLMATLPLTVDPAGRYRLRVVQADGLVLGFDNGQDLTFSPAAPTPTLTQQADGSLLASLPTGSPAPARYEWERDGGLLPSVNGAQLAAPATGYYHVRACSSGCCGCWSDSLLVVGDLIVSSTQSVQGTYRNVTITGPTTGGAGVATLNGPLTVLGTLAVQDGGTLRTSCQPLLGTGAVVVAAGATLHVCDAAGLSSSGRNGAVQVSGARTFSPDASYVYDGTAPQVTGPGLPGQVRNLTIDNPAGLTQSQALAVAQVLALRRGDLRTSGQPLTLLSTAAGTALIDNAGGLVRGTGTMQRYLDQANAAGVGYRHYAAPVSNATLTDLTTSGYAPVLNAAYNASPTPTLVSPFPTLYGYAEGRLSTSPATSGSVFDKGWYSPATLADPMPVGRGFTAWVPSAELVDFTGTFTSGPVTLNGLTRGPQAEAGWHLLGNPYPAPIDWRRVAPAERPGLDAAVYVFQSTGPYTGTYRAALNGLGDALIPAGAGFFVRTSTAGIPGSLTFTDAHRLTTFGPQPGFGRDVADTRPRLQLRVTGGGNTDALYLYLEDGAGAGVLPAYDATKLANSTGLNLASLSGSTPLAINGLPPLTQTEQVVPLTLTVPQAGSFSFEVAELAYFDATTVYLRDAQTGQQTLLSPQTRYNVTLATATAGQGRFSLVLRPGSVTTSQASSAALAVQLYPNPAQNHFYVRVPPVPGTSQVEATLLNSLGQIVRHLSIPVRAAGAEAEVDVRELPAGVYALRVRSGSQQQTLRLVLQ